MISGDQYFSLNDSIDSLSRSVQMKLYTMHKREFVMVFIGFFTCLGLAIFIGIAGKLFPIIEMQNIMNDLKGHQLLEHTNSMV